MEYKVRVGINDQSLEIEDAETKILAFCKRAFTGQYTKDQFKRGVDKIIHELCEKLTNDTLKEKARKALRLYAQKTYSNERQIATESAIFYSLVITASRYGADKAQKYKKTFEDNVSSAYRSSPGFKRLLNMELDHTAYNSSVPLNTYYKEYMKRVEELTEELVTRGAKEDYTTNVSLRNIAEMTVRYEHQVNMIDEKRQSGVKLVYILPHANCSKRCEKYQVGGSLHPSGLYSLDGSTGVTKEGIKYRPLEFATDNPIDRYTTKAGITYQNGCLTGFNCRHTLGDYKPGAKPIAIPEKVIAKRREIEQKQREYERQIREQKKLYIQLKDVNPKAAKAAKLRGEKLYDEYKNFSRKNEVAYTPDRIKLFESDKEFKSIVEQERATKNRDFAVENKVIQSRKYRDKFNKITDNLALRRDYYKAAKEMLNHRSGQNGEDLYLYNTETKEWFKSTSGTEVGHPEYSEDIEKAIKKASPGELIAFHNHPNSMPPSASDINAALKNGYSKGYVFCHNGKIFEYTPSEEWVNIISYELHIAKYKKMLYNEFEAQVRTMKELSKDFGFLFKEVK